MKKTIFIIPGFKEKVSDKQYKWMKLFFREKGFIVQMFPVKWDYRTISDYADSFQKYFFENKTDRNYVLGFSFGAMTAFIAAAQVKPDKLFLCSLSPYFKEDLKVIKSSWERVIGKRRLADFKTKSANTIADQITAPTVIFCGEKEAEKYPRLKKRCENTTERIKKCRLVMVPNAPHQIDHPEYVKAIKREFD